MTDKLEVCFSSDGSRVSSVCMFIGRQVFQMKGASVQNAPPKESRVPQGK